MASYPDLILHNGKIFTVDERRPWTQAVAISGAHFVAVGGDEEILGAAGPETQVVDLNGRLALPGLCDAHIHFYDWSVSRRQVPLSGSTSMAEMMARIHEWAGREPAEGWLSGRNWNQNLWDDSRMPTRSDLDRVTGEERPAIFWRVDMHCAVANSAALRIAGIDAASPEPHGGVIGRDEHGQPNGLLWELAINQVSQFMPKPGPRELDIALGKGMTELHRLGVTAVHDQRMKDQDEGPVALGGYLRLRRSGRLKLRVNCNIAAHDLPHLVALGLQGGFGDDYLRLGHIKLFTDGSMGSQTAWMLDPYLRAGNGTSDDYGVCVTPPEQMAMEIRQAIQGGFPVSVHAIGDRANREVLDIFEELLLSQPNAPIPHRIEHVQIIDALDLPRLGSLNLTASVQPIHALDDMDVADSLFADAADRVYRFRSLADSGALLALGSDAPVADPNPFLGFQAAIGRQRPDQMALGPWFGEERLTLEQTIHGYTLGAAQASGWEEVIGSISPGKRADLIVIDRDLFRLIKNGERGSEIAQTQVDMTIFDGEMVFNR